MGVTVRTVFRHAGKTDATDAIWRERERLFAAFKAADDKLAALTALPWIGAVTRQRLAQRLSLAEPNASTEPTEEQTGGRNAASRPHKTAGDWTPTASPHGRRPVRPASGPAPLARIGART
jgi:hypothetical protein